jgi:3-oxoacyl-(acyl-carrier-protein) synthase
MGAYTPSLDPAMAVRPFDKNRTGTALGDGAAMLVLEGAEHAIKRGASIYGTLAGVAMQRCGKSIARPDAEGEFLTMDMALQRAGLGPGAVDIVFAHATATKAGDTAEAYALKKLFDKRTLIAATKGSLVSSLHRGLWPAYGFYTASLTESAGSLHRRIECDGCGHWTTVHAQLCCAPDCQP